MVGRLSLVCELSLRGEVNLIKVITQPSPGLPEYDCFPDQGDVGITLLKVFFVPRGVNIVFKCDQNFFFHPSVILLNHNSHPADPKIAQPYLFGRYGTFSA